MQCSPSAVQRRSFTSLAGGTQAAPGRYAIMAYHDENSDGKLNLRLGMFPTEGYGLSNNPKVFGPPKFADSAFDLKGDEATVEIEISY